MPIFGSNFGRNEVNRLISALRTGPYLAHEETPLAHFDEPLLWPANVKNDLILISHCLQRSPWYLDMRLGIILILYSTLSQLLVQCASRAENLPHQGRKRNLNKRHYLRNQHSKDIGNEVQVIVCYFFVRSLKSSILSSTCLQMGKTFWGVASAAVGQKTYMVARGDGKFGHWGHNPSIPGICNYPV